MADASRVIDIIFAGVDNVSGTINTVSGQMSSFGDSVEAVAAPLANVADTILKVDAVLTTLAIGGLTYAYAKSIEFEASLVELKKVVGDQPKALNEAADAAIELSNKYGESSAEVLLSTADFKQAGFDIYESMSLTKDAMDLSIAGSIGASEASELLISTLKGFKSPASEAARLVDVLNEVSNNYAVNVRQLGIGMADLSPIASLMGFSFEETAGILTPVIEVFRSGSEAAISLKTGLLRLIDDSKPVADALASIGVAQKDVNGNLRSGKDILYDVATAFQSADENDKLFLATQLVGIQQAGRMVEVFDGLAKSTEVTSIAFQAAGSAAKEVAARLESGEVSVKRFAEGFKNLAIVVGDQFKEAAKNAIDGGTAIENALQKMVDEGTFKPVFDSLSKFGSDIGKYLNEIALALPEAFEGIDWSVLLDAFDDISAEFKTMFEGLDLTKPEDLREAIQFLINSIATLVKVTKGMVEVFGPIVQDLIKAAEGFNQLDDATKESTGNILAIAKAITDFGFIMFTVIKILGENAKLIEVVFSTIVNSLSFLFETGVIVFKGIGLVIFTLVEGALALANIFTLGLSETIKDQIALTKEYQESFKEGIIKSYGLQIQNVDSIIKAMSEDTDKLSTSIQALPDDTIIGIEIKTDETDLTDFIASISGLPDWTQIKLIAAMKEGNLDEVDKILSEFTSDKTITFDENKTKENAEKIVEVTTTETDKIPSEKEIEILLKGEIATEIERIKAQAETIQASMEWQAKVDIAEAEAAARTIEAAFDAVGVAMVSTGDTLVGLWSVFANLDAFEQSALMREIERESARRDEALELQRRLTDAQIEYMDARTEALASGQALITIDGSGLEPHLEAFMWAVVEKVQLRVIEEQSDFLLGIT